MIYMKQNILDKSSWDQLYVWKLDDLLNSAVS